VVVGATIVASWILDEVSWSMARNVGVSVPGGWVPKFRVTTIGGKSCLDGHFWYVRGIEALRVWGERSVNDAFLK
jgi:hypothetical protein